MADCVCLYRYGSCAFSAADDPFNLRETQLRHCRFCPGLTRTCAQTGAALRGRRFAARHLVCVLLFQDVCWPNLAGRVGISSPCGTMLTFCVYEEAHWR